MSRRAYDGPALDGTVQYISEAPVWNADGETVDAPGDDTRDAGTETTEDDPVPSENDRPDATGQTTLEDWGWSP